MKEKKITGDDEWIKAILLWEKSHGYDNYGFTSLPKGSVTDINDAIALYKKDYLPLIEDLPEGLRPVAGDFAFNSEDPRASILVASGIITPDEKIKMYKGGKLDPAIVSQKWNENKESVISQYNSNPNEFLDKFDNERIRSYKNTNGADKNLKEWEQRVSDSRSVSNNIINSSAKEVKTPVSDKKNEAALGLKEEVPQYNTNTTRKANTALAGAGSGMNNSVATDNKTINRDTPPEGAKVKHSTGTYVYTGGKWRHKSGDGYDFSANATNEKLLNEKVKNGDYEVWDNKAGGYVKGAPVARTAESIKAGGEFRLGLNKKTPLVDNGEGSPDLAEKIPQVKAVPPAAKQIASKKAAGDGITPREQLPTTGITTGSTIKDALGKLGGGGDTPLAKQSELYDPESYLAVKAGKKGLDLGKFGGVTDYLPDVFKAAMGLAGANEKLPEFKTPQYFTDYENKLREQSTQGLTDAEYAQSMRSADRGYAYDVNNISNFAGGRPGVALANLGRAANTLQDAYGNINVADAQMQRQNLQQYGGAVNTHLGIDQNNFNQKFNIAAQNKMAGAQLAADAFANISNRRDFNEAYGKGSAYAKYQESLLQGQEYQNSILDYILKNPSALPEYNPNIMNQNTTIPNYQNYYLPKPTQAPITG